MAEVPVNPGDLIKCERARIRARRIKVRNKPQPATGRDQAQEAIADTTVRIKIEKLYRKVGEIPLK